MIKKIRSARGFTLVELMIVVAIVGILAALAIFGVKKYVTNSKTAEARNALGEISKLAAGAWSRDVMAGAILADEGVVGGSNALCASSVPVPDVKAKIKGQKYQSSTVADKDYNSGSATVGWTCLKFSMEGPQYFMYTYTADNTAKTFNAKAEGDLNGDDNLSSFVRGGEIRKGQVVLSPAIIETNPDE